MAHAYLFSGPRGTGKTSTARILAKALNCTDLRDGEPCGVCPSCVEIARGTSLDVHELDAASNNGVDAMRDLVSRAALGTPGRQKVYIVDEVHMLSTAASNALLKTLEEPPAHVVFVLATTDPQKVLPTIRSRTQHFEFRLLGADTLCELLAQVRSAAHLEVADEALDLAVRRGRGSARDALSILDQVAASDTVEDDLPELDEVVEALAERDVGRALVAVAHLTAAGFSPQQLAGRPGRPPPPGVPGPGRPRAGDGGGQRAGRHRPPRPGGWDWPPWSGPWRSWGGPRWPCATPPTPGSTSRWRWSAWSTPRPTTSPAALLARIERLEREGVAAPAPSAGSPTAPAAQWHRRWLQPRHPPRLSPPPRLRLRCPDRPHRPPPPPRRRSPAPPRARRWAPSVGSRPRPPPAAGPGRRRGPARRRPGSARAPPPRPVEDLPAVPHPGPAGAGVGRPRPRAGSGPRPRPSTRPAGSPAWRTGGPSSACPTRSTASGARRSGATSRPPWPSTSAVGSR